MKKIFLDTNVMLDYVLNRTNYEYADIILRLAQTGKLDLYSSFLSYANMAYILRKHTKDEVKTILVGLRRVVKVLPMTDNQLIESLNCEAPDFEDMLQYRCAIDNECEMIVTNNTKHFKDFCTLSLLTPEELLLGL